MEVKSISDIKSIEHFKNVIEHKQYLLQIYRQYMNELSNLSVLATEYRGITTEVLKNINKYEDDVSNNEIIVNFNIINEDNQIEQQLELDSELKAKTKKINKKSVIEQQIEQQIEVESEEKPKVKKTIKKVTPEEIESEEIPKAKKTTKKVTPEEIEIESEEKPKAKKTTKKVI